MHPSVCGASCSDLQHSALAPSAMKCVRRSRLSRFSPPLTGRGPLPFVGVYMRGTGSGRVLVFRDWELDEMAQLYRHGWSCDQLAVRYDCRSGSIQTRLRKMGVEMRPKKRWRCVAHRTSHGYILWDGEYVHRIVASAWRGTPLLDGEVVHHIDGDKTNNHPDNLQVFASHSEHLRSEAWRTRWTPDLSARLAAFRASGMTHAEIARVMGVKTASVNNRAADMVAAGLLARVRRGGRRKSA